MSTNDNHELRLTTLSEGLPAVTSALGTTMAEAGAVCFVDQEHKNGVELHLSGTFVKKFKVFWPELTDQMLRCWDDPEDATEHAACGIAFLLVRSLTDFTIIRRSRKGTGFDYWLGYQESEDELPFQNKARLEISGIRNGSNSQVNLRVRKKLEQVKPTDNLGLPGYIVVVEFGAPQAQMVQK